MAGVLDQVLEIKSFREARAGLAVTRQRLALDRAVAEVQAKQDTLMTFTQEAHRKERALFDDLCSRVVRLSQIQDVHLAVDELRAQTREHEKKLEQARAARHREAQALEDRRAEHSRALQVKERFVELVRVAAEEAEQEVDRLEALELEEVAEIRSGRVQSERQQEQESA
jgi:type III secretion protein O